MERLKLVAAVFFIGFLASCNQDTELSQEEEAKNLSQLFSEIEELANSLDCTHSEDWTYTSYGSKACGGPIGFIAYSVNIDTELFLEKIEIHRNLQIQFNQKWGLISDCSVPQQPGAIVCEEGNPAFEY